MIVYEKETGTPHKRLNHIEKACCEKMEKICNSINYEYVHECPFCKKKIIIVSMKDFNCFEKVKN